MTTLVALRDQTGVPIYAMYPPELDPLVHSLRWIRERPLEHLLIRLHDWRRAHYGDRPRAVVVSYQLGQELKLQHMRGVYVYEPANLTLLGMYLVQRRDAAGISFE